MQITTFSQQKWDLKTFNKIGYCHDNKRLYIFHLTGKVVEFSSIEEKVVFQFILSLEKERFIEEILYGSFPFKTKYNEASLSG